MPDGQTGDTLANTQPLPHNIEAEQALLGALMVNNDVYDRVSGIVQAEHFYDPVHARIFEVAAERIKKNALATPVTLKAFLEDDEGLNELGGPAYLARLAGASISLFAAKDYAQLIYDLAIRRELILIGQVIAEKAARMDVDSEPREIAGAAELVQAGIVLEESLERDGRGERVLLDPLGRDVEDARMDGIEKMFGLDDSRHAVIDVVVDHQRAQKRLFRLDVVGKRLAFGVRVAGLSVGHVRVSLSASL